MSEWIWVVAGYLGVFAILILYIGFIHRRNRSLARQFSSVSRKDDG